MRGILLCPDALTGAVSTLKAATERDSWNRDRSRDPTSAGTEPATIPAMTIRPFGASRSMNSGALAPPTMSMITSKLAGTGSADVRYAWAKAKWASGPAPPTATASVNDRSPRDGCDVSKPRHCDLAVAATAPVNRRARQPRTSACVARESFAKRGLDVTMWKSLAALGPDRHALPTCGKIVETAAPTANQCAGLFDHREHQRAHWSQSGLSSTHSYRPIPSPAGYAAQRRATPRHAAPRRAAGTHFVGTPRAGCRCAVAETSH